ncbi:MAG: carboxymuconolactone decarboxylase [Bacteroidetes bacterium]|nr:carboxymuconolactone decarboxylase [Fibrella sp.]
MAHIQLNNDAPGIRSLALYRPDTGKSLYELAQTLLRAGSPDSTLTDAERELIAAFVSAGNCTNFCRDSHAAAARYLYGDQSAVVDQTLADSGQAPISAKLRALLTIADHVRTDARTVSDQLVSAARHEGATDGDIHDTVLIAAAFCMFNRYVDGLAAAAPTDPALYRFRATRVVEDGYSSHDAYMPR